MEAVRIYVPARLEAVRIYLDDLLPRLEALAASRSPGEPSTITLDACQIYQDLRWAAGGSLDVAKFVDVVGSHQHDPALRPALDTFAAGADFDDLSDALETLVSLSELDRRAYDEQNLWWHCLQAGWARVFDPAELENFDRPWQWRPRLDG